MADEIKDEQVVTTPVETPKADEQVANTQEPEGGEVKPEVKKDVEGEDKTPPAIRKRIDEITAKKYAADREAAKAREEAAYWRGKAEAISKPDTVTPSSDAEPNLAEFESVDAYTRAMVQWGNKQAFAQAEKAHADRIATEAKAREDATIEQSLDAQIKKAQERYPDFNDLVMRQPADGGVVISEITANVLKASDMGAEVAYYLAKNAGEAARLAAINNPLLAAREIGRIEAKLSIAPKPEVRPSNAPPPIAPLGGKTGEATVDTSKMTDDEWHRYRQAEITAQYANRK